MRIFKNTIYILFAFCLIACTKEISVDVAHEPQTIIFGSINQETAPVVITIQQSLPLNATGNFSPVENASIALYEEYTNGNFSLLTDSFNASNGTYTSNQPITTTVGNKYWIEVVLADGTRFVSARELLKPVIPIEEIEITEDDYVEIYFTDPGDDANFYNFSVELRNFGSLVSISRSESNDIVFNGSDEALVELDLYNYYSDDDQDTDFNQITVKLENINFESYQFYLNQTFQLDNNDSDGAGDPSPLFATPPVNIEGNITNITENKRALGNFTVRAISTVNETIVN